MVTKAELTRWASALAGALREATPSIVGLSGIGLVVTGVWGLWGWQWAAILAGLPVSAFYIYGEIRRATPGRN